jgi:hypothetical protein
LKDQSDYLDQRVHDARLPSVGGHRARRGPSGAGASI